MKQIITGCMAMIILAACNNNSYSTTSTDTVRTNTKPAGSTMDTQMNRMNDSVSRDHTTNADTGLHPTR